MLDPRGDSPDAFDQLLQDELSRAVTAPPRMTASVMGRVGYMRVAEGERRRRQRRRRIVRATAATMLIAAMGATGILLHATDRLREASDGFAVEAAVTRDVDTARQAVGRTISSFRQVRSLIPAADETAGRVPVMVEAAPDLQVARAATSVAPQADSATADPEPTVDHTWRTSSDPLATFAEFEGRPMPAAGVWSFPGTRAADPFAPPATPGVNPAVLPFELPSPGSGPLMPRGPRATWTLPESVDRSAIGPVASRSRTTDVWPA